ncbi:MAG TPA: hypothetical protein VMV10_01805 [Pirellulales bacterium]|nr:hypothetical protein [Pirellulales bacterium]
MQDVNPYAAPKYDLPLNRVLTEPGDGVWRDGDLLVMRKGAVLPDRCAKCNAAAEAGRLKLTLRWHDPIFFLMLPIWPIIVLFVMETAKIEIGVCGRHRRQRRFAILVGGFSFLFCVASIVGALGGSALPIPLFWRVVWFLTAGVALLAVSIRANLNSILVSPHKIDRDYVWLKKIDPGYLAQFPPVNR